MSETEIDKKKIESLLPHREPMLLIDKLTKIVPLKSATAVMYVKKDGFYVQGHFPGQPVMPGVLIVEAFGQTAAAITPHGLDKETNDTIRLILVGASSLILLQAMIHIGVNIRLFPTTGMTLPFLSYGGSSLIGSAILAGIILNYTKIKLEFNE